MAARSVFRETVGSRHLCPGQTIQPRRVAEENSALFAFFLHGSKLAQPRAPWAPKFRGPGSDVSLKEWTSQTKYLADLQGLTEQQRLQFLLGSLEGEAKRELQAAPEEKRSTPQAVLAYLKDLYGDKTPAAALRAQFFNCRQGPTQSIRSFALQLRELFVRLKNRDNHGLGDEDALMRDQFLLGLRDGPIRQCLKTQLRRDANLTYEAIRKEALALELDQQETNEQPVSVAASSASAPAPPSTTDWKRELHAEIMKDVKEQMAELSRTLLEDLCKEIFDVQQLQQAETSWLTLRGANGLDIPYTGYIVADFQVQGVVVPEKGVVVVRNHCLGNHRALLGMNVISGCWEQLFQNRKDQPPRHTHIPEVRDWEHILADCHRIHTARAQGEREDTARVSCRYALAIPAHSEALVWAKVPSRKHGQDVWVVVEPHLECKEVEVARAIATVHRGRVPVRVRNTKPYPVHLHHHQGLARVTTVTPSQVVEGTDVCFTRVGPGVVEVGVVHTEQGLGMTAGRMPDHLCCESLQGENLDGNQQQQLQQLLDRWQHVFSTHDEDYGCTDVVKHQIPTGDVAPSRERYRPVPPTLYQEVRSLLRGMLEGGIIRESSSPWAAPIVLVQKKTGAWRFCVDYRKLNSMTKKDAFPLPRIEDSLTSLSQAAWYSTLDLASGYWQVQVEERDREKTAFTTPFGLFEWDRMPFGLCNAPATFQRLMQRCLGGQLVESTLVYLDDVIVFSPDFPTHLRHLEEVFRAMERYGLKLRPEKCQLFRQEVKFLGHCVSYQGVAPDPEKVSAVQEWQPPKTVKQVRSFLGFVGYYRRFIKDFSKIAKPLNELLVGTGRPRGRGSPTVTWGPECDAAFQKLKAELLQAPILAYADFSQPFTLYTDASNAGLGAVLAQQQGGVERVIAYASRSLHPAERNDSNYSSFKIELLALKWALSEKFKDYLWGAKVMVVTDNNPLVHLHTAKLGAVEQRWVAQLANYDYQIRYRPGREHTNADVLSRLPVAEKVPPAVTPSTQPEEGLLVAVIEAPGTDEGAVPVGWGWNPRQWAELQAEDPDLRVVHAYLERGALPPAEERRAQTQTVRQILSHWGKLSLQEGVLCRAIQDNATHEVMLQVVVPQPQIQALLKAYHTDMGHQGQERTLSLIRRNFYWLRMEESVSTFIQSCPRCTLHKKRPDARAPLVPIVPKAPLHILAADFLTLSRPTDRYQNILVATDLFTKYAWAIPTSDQTAITTARALWSNVIQPFGCPETLHSDQGPNFEAKVVQELCQLYGCRKTRTTPYHPQGNGGCERFNQTLLGLLGTLEKEQQDRWVEYLPSLLQAYNNSVHSTTGYAPSYLMFGRHVRLPTDMLLGVAQPEGAQSTTDWVGRHHQRLRYAYEKVTEHLGAAAAKNKRLYDRTAQDAPLLPGERVLVREHQRRGRGKLSDRWESGPYVVVGCPRPNVPVYTVRPEGRSGPDRVLHRNLLRPCPNYPMVDSPTPEGPEASEALQGPLLGWTLAPGAPTPVVEESPPPQHRRSQRDTQGRPPVRYGNWVSRDYAVFRETVGSRHLCPGQTIQPRRVAEENSALFAFFLHGSKLAQPSI
ncbi:uncharacterized protein LOC134073108 [Sardina pilchardus]|uniref:uncharacterized protein LOC134073108 n=1 Tax=Sardina pilchardus TaxID=27697 RepID=UPI002E1395F6